MSKTELSDVVNDETIVIGKNIDNLFEKIRDYFVSLNGNSQEKIVFEYNKIVEDENLIKYINVTIKGEIKKLPNMLEKWQKEGNIQEVVYIIIQMFLNKTI